MKMRGLAAAAAALLGGSAPALPAAQHDGTLPAASVGLAAAHAVGRRLAGGGSDDDDD
jgi:hypothetical protein